MIEIEFVKYSYILVCEVCFIEFIVVFAAAYDSRISLIRTPWTFRFFRLIRLSYIL